MMQELASPPSICRFAVTGRSEGYLCHCARVTEAVVRAVVVSGEAAAIEEVVEKTGAGSGCRACHCRIQRVLGGLPAQCGGRFDQCHECGCIAAICRCAAA